MNSSSIKLNTEIKEKLVKSLKLYIESEFEVEIGAFQAQFLLDFILDEFGPFFYNQAIEDTHKWLAEKFLYLTDDLYMLSKDEKY